MEYSTPALDRRRATFLPDARWTPQVLLPLSCISFLVPCVYTGSLLFQNKKLSKKMKPRASKCSTLNNFLSSKLATLSKCEEIKLDINSVQVPQGHSLLGNRGKRMLEENSHKSLLFSAINKAFEISEINSSWECVIRIRWVNNINSSLPFAAYILCVSTPYPLSPPGQPHPDRQALFSFHRHHTENFPNSHGP